VSGQRPPEDTVGDDSGSRSTPEGTVGEDSGSFYTPHGTAVGDDGGSDKRDDAASSPERVCVGIRAEQYADDNMDTATDCASSVDTSGCCSVSAASLPTNNAGCGTAESDAVFPHGTQPRPPEDAVGNDSDDCSATEATVGDDTGRFTAPKCTVGEDSGSDKLDDAASSPERVCLGARAELSDDEDMRTATDRASSVDASGCCSLSVASLPTDVAEQDDNASVRVLNLMDDEVLSDCVDLHARAVRLEYALSNNTEQMPELLEDFHREALAFAVCVVAYMEGRTSDVEVLEAARNLQRWCAQVKACLPPRSGRTKAGKKKHRQRKH